MRRKKPNRAFRFFADQYNYEGIEWSYDGKDVIIQWIWSGKGEVRQPIATIHNERIIVTWNDTVIWPMPSRAFNARPLMRR